MKRIVLLTLALALVLGTTGLAQQRISVGIDQTTRGTWQSIASEFEGASGHNVTLHAYPQSNVAQQVVFQSFSQSGEHHFFMIPTSWGASLYRYMEDLSEFNAQLTAGGVEPAVFSGRTLGVHLPFASNWFLAMLDWPEDREVALQFLILAGGGEGASASGSATSVPSTSPGNSGQSQAGGSETAKIALSEHNPKIDGALGALLSAASSAVSNAASQISSFLPSSARSAVAEVAEMLGVPFSQTTNTVTVVLEPRTSAASTAVALSSLGVSRSSIDQGNSLVKVTVSLSDLETLATQLTGVTFLRAPYVPYPLSTPTEGTAAIGADAFHTAGLTGTGVKVAVVDLGFVGLSQAKARGDLPASAIGNDLTGMGLETGFSHGTAVAEIVHDIAPGAQLYLIKIADEVDLDQAVTYCIANGIDIINHSLGWYNTNFYDGTGTIADIAGNATSNGILWINAAGNEAQSHWEGTFIDGNSDGWNDSSITFSASSGNQIVLYLTWNEWPASSTDYDLYLYDAGNNLVASSTKYQTGTEEPTESIQVTAPSSGTFTVRIQGTGSRQLELFSVYQNLAPAVAASSILAPANASSVVAVGAVDHASYTFGPVEPYSSQGPSNTGLTKPDLVAPDNVTTGTAPYTSFPGTSGAAPHAAGAAALLLSQQPTLSEPALRSLLLSQTVAMGSPNQYGNGRLVLQAPTSPNVPPVASYSFSPASPTVGSIVTFNGTSSSDSDGSIVSYTWDFNNDGFADATTAVATYAFPTTGAYSVRLTVQDDDGATDTETKTVNVISAPNQAPTAAFAATPSTAGPNEWISFDASASTDVDGAIVGYSWSFGDGDTGSGANAFHRYTNAGVYTVQLIVTDDDGATNAATQQITIQQAAAPDLVPTALTASPASPTVGQTLTFNYTVQNIGSDTAATFRVLLQGTANSTQAYVSSIAPGGSRAGILTLPLTSSSETFTLTVDDLSQVPESNEANNTRSITVTAAAPSAPVADAGGPYAGDVGQTIIFDGSGSTGSITSYFWTFGDGGTASGISPTHSYSLATTYTVTLTVSGPGGQDSDSALVTVSQAQPGMTAQLSLPQAAYQVGEALVITYSVNRPAYVYLCDVSPDNRVVLLYPSLFENTEPVAAGTYQVPGGFYTLRVSEPAGTETLYLFASSVPIPEFPTSFGFGFPTLSTSPGTFRDGVLATMQILAGPGNWAFDTLSFEVLPETPTTGMLEVITFPSNATVRLDGATLGNSPLQQSGVTPGVHTIQVSKTGYQTETQQVTIVAGQTSTVQITLTALPPANQAPNASFTASPSSPEVGELVTFDASGSSDTDGAIVSYEWNFGDGGTGSGVVVSHAFPANVTYQVALTVRDDDGATDTATKSVAVVPGDDIGWESPASHEDPANEWAFPERAYDNNIDHNDLIGANIVLPGGGTSSFLFYNMGGGGLQANGVRLFTSTSGSGQFNWDIDVERDGAWVDVFDDAIETDWEWTQIAFDQGLVTRVRVRATNPVGGPTDRWRAVLYELDVRDALATP